MDRRRRAAHSHIPTTKSELIYLREHCAPYDLHILKSNLDDEQCDEICNQTDGISSYYYQCRRKPTHGTKCGHHDPIKKEINSLRSRIRWEQKRMKRECGWLDDVEGRIERSKEDKLQYLADIEKLEQKIRELRPEEKE